MKEKGIIAAGLVGSVAVNAAIGTYTETATLLAATPVGIVVYLLLGIALPQFVIYRQSQASGALGVSVVVSLVSGLVVLVAFLDAGLFSDWGSGFLNLLLVAILGILFSVAGRAFAQGYRA